MQAKIRLAICEDSEQILNIYSPIVTLTSISFEYEPPTVQQMAVRIEKVLRQHPWLVCEMDNQIAGYVYGGTHRERTAYQWSVEVTAYIHEQYRGRRIGKALYNALFEILAFQGYYSAFAGITLPNPASVALHESVGFKPIGVFHNIGYKFGQWHDVGWWERPLQPAKADPELPRSIQEVASAEAVTKALETGMASIRASTQPIT